MRGATAPVLALVVLVFTGAASAAPVPSSLKTLESSAEDLVDSALSQDRAGVTATARQLRALANGPAASSLARAGVPHATIARLEQRAKVVAHLAAHAAFVRVALAANAVSGLMPDLYERFHDRVPPAVLALDYLDREAQLRAVVGERTRVADAVKRLASTWAGLRHKVVAAGGAHAAAAYGSHVAAMQRLRHRSLRSVQDEAVRGLALVDRLEAVFTR
jgi:hypothetical protein